MTHRGPDSEGYLVDEGVALGMRRLAIIDLLTGEQPTFNEDHTVAVVLNGELYNYRELRADLEAAAGRMLWIFVPYAIAVVGSMAPRMIPSTDLRSATSVFALGPLSAIRSLVMIVGVAYGAAPSRLAETKLLGAFVLLLMLSLEIVLNFLAARAQARQIGDLLSE
jgi:hypothetical protein